jgi:hypothetical protein
VALGVGDVGPGVTNRSVKCRISADGIGVVDLATKLARKYGGDDPEVFDLSPDGSTIHVSNEDAAQTRRRRR